MKSKKLLSGFLAVVMSISAFAALTVTASAVPSMDKINLGASVIAEKDNLYYGNAKKWRVLSTEGNTTQNGASTETASFKDDSLNDVDAENALFVIAEDYYSKMKFDDDSNAWSGSLAQAWANSDFYTAAGISEDEKAEILTTAKSDLAYKTNEYYANKTSVKELTYSASSINDKVFLLSANELETFLDDQSDRAYTNNGNTPDSCYWFLRSPDGTDKIGMLRKIGLVWSNNYDDTTFGTRPRPAFNLNKENVLFTSAAVGGKVAGAVEAYTGSDWKVTLLDSTRTFETGEVIKDSDKVTVAYSNAKTTTDNANEKVSYIITDENKTEVKYYGSQASTSAEGSINITLPSDLVATDKLFIFNEQANGDNMTDFASALQEVKIPFYTVTAGAASGYTGAPETSVQALVTGSTAVMRFIWGIDFNGAGKPDKLGAVFIDFGNPDKCASIQDVDASTLTDKGFFFGDITNISETNFAKKYFAIPYVNGVVYLNAKIGDKVDNANIDKGGN